MNTPPRPARRRLLAAALFAALLAGASVAATAQTAPAAGAASAPASVAPAFQAAFSRFTQAGNGDRRAVQDAAEQFAALSAAQPAEPVLMAYAGATEALRATTTWLPWKKLGHVEDGLARIDKALALAAQSPTARGPLGLPAQLEVRFVAANTFLALPAFFNRQARGEKLLAEVLAQPALAEAALPFRGAVWLRAAQLAKAQSRPDEARRLAQSILSAGAPQAAAAQALLKALGA